MPQLTKAMMSEAGAWMARLNGPYRTPRVEQGFQQWLKDDARHAEAFRLVSVDWEGMEELRRFANVTITAPVSSPVPTNKHQPRARYWLAAAAAAAVCVISSWLYYQRSSGVVTGIGEQRIVTLQDGSKIHLNTSTRVVVQYDKARRRVRLDAGEAMFEVAQQAHWPFTVDTGDRQVRALGTSFLVRRDSSRTSVTLIEGKVAVSSMTASAVPETDRAAAAAMGAVTLEPGQRLTFSSRSKPPTVDRPVLDKLTAWQQGKVAIDKMRLAEAVDEMNRYSPVHLVIEQPESRQLLVSGVFTAGQSASFARAVAQSYGLEVIDQGDTLRLAGHARVPE